MTNIKGYFNDCEESTKLQYGYNYYLFLRGWLKHKFPNYEVDYECVVFHFSHEGLHKVNFVSDRRIKNSLTGDQWINGVVDLDRMESEAEDEFRTEFNDNLAKFMKYIRFSNLAVPISDSDFILPIFSTVTLK